MIYKSSYISFSSGLEWSVVYEELDTFDMVKDLPIEACGTLCFYNDKFVLVYAKSRKCWEMPGGGREGGESIEECAIREIKEESNMKVLELYPLGIDTDTDPQTNEKHIKARFAAKVKPYGDFRIDPDGEITEIKLVELSELKSYWDWGERGEAMLRKAKEKCGIK